MRKPSPNLCDDQTREPAPAVGVSAGSGRVDRAEHLASCPSCASQAESDAPLMRLWDATVPPEPSEAAWDAVWARVADGLERPEPEVATPLVFAFPWRKTAVVAFVTAQAAAVLAVAMIWEAANRAPEHAVTQAPIARLRAVIDIEPGQVVMIHMDGNEFRAFAPAHEGAERWDALDENLVLFNDAEALAGMQETIAEMRHDVDLASPPG